MADRPSRSLPPTPVCDSAARERSPVRPVRMASVSPQGGAQAAAARGSAGSVGQQTGGSGGGTTTDLMVRSLEKVMQQLQGMSNQFGELRLTNERQQRQLDDLLTGFRGLERQVNSGEGVGGQGVAQGASPQRPSAQGAGSGTPAWGSSNLPDPWGAAWEAARLQGAGSTTYSGPDGQRGPYSGVGGTTSGAPNGQGPNGVFGPAEGPDPPPGFARGHLAQRREPILGIGTAVGKTKLGPTGDVPRMLAMVRLKEVVEVRNPRMRRRFNEASVGCRHHQSQNTRVGAVGYRR